MADPVTPVTPVTYAKSIGGPLAYLKGRPGGLQWRGAARSGAAWKRTRLDFYRFRVISRCR